MTTERKNLHLQDGNDDKLDVLVTADAGASITYGGAKSMTFNAAAFKFRQKGQTQDMDLFGKFATVEQTVQSNLDTNNAAIKLVDDSSAAAKKELEGSGTDLGMGNKNTEANAKFEANQGNITTEVGKRLLDLTDLDNKFSKDFAGDEDTDPGLLYTMNADISTERGRIDNENKVSTTDDGDKGDRQKAIDTAKSTADAAIDAQKKRVNTATQQISNLFAGIPSDELKNLANLISDYKNADSSLTNILASSRATLDSLRVVFDTTFPIDDNIFYKLQSNDNTHFVIQQNSPGLLDYYMEQQEKPEEGQDFAALILKDSTASTSNNSGVKWRAIYNATNDTYEFRNVEDPNVSLGFYNVWYLYADGSVVNMNSLSDVNCKLTSTGETDDLVRESQP